MKKFITTILIILVSFTTYASIESSRKDAIESYVETISPNTSIETIPQLIVSKSSTTEEKIFAIYTWIDKNITYNYNLQKCDACDRKIYDDYTYVYKHKTGVCAGQSNLFRYLAVSNGLDAYVIGGIGINSGGQRGGHSWNVVRDNNKYYFVDATWATNKRFWITTNYTEFKKTHIDEEAWYNYTYNEYEDYYISHNKIYAHHMILKNSYYINSSKSLEDYTKNGNWSTQEVNDLKVAIRLRHYVKYTENFSNSKVEEVTIKTTPVKTITVEAKKEVSKEVKAPKVLTMSKSELKNNSIYTLYKYKNQLALYVKDYYSKNNAESIGQDCYNRIKNSKKGDYMKEIKKYRKYFNLS